LIFQQKFQIKNLASILIPRLGFFSAPTNQVVLLMAGPHALSQLNPDRDKIFGFSGSKNFQGASKATTSAANGFTFGALVNLQAPTASFTAPYSHEARYQAYLKRVLEVTSNQGLLKRAPMKFFPPNLPMTLPICSICSEHWSLPQIMV